MVLKNMRKKERKIMVIYNVCVIGFYIPLGKLDL